MSRHALVLVVASLVFGCGEGPDADPKGWTADDIALNNRGVALMGYFDYPGALAAFSELVERRPDLVDVRVNLAIATLNRQQEGDEALAMAIVDAVLAERPGDVRAQYVKGLLLLNAGHAEAARTYFESVTRQRPDDAYAAYFTAQTLSKTDQLEAAVVAYRRAIDADPYLRSAYYGAAQTLRRLGKSDEARALLDDYQRFDGNPRARLAEFKYTRMGPLANAWTVDAGAAPPPAPPSGSEFADRVTLLEALARDAADPAHVTSVDLNDDGIPDLVIGTPAGNTVMLGSVDGAMSVAGDHPLAAVSRVRAALWGDIDNDGLVDVYFCRDGDNALWLQSAPGVWRDATDAAGVAGTPLVSVGGAIFDADHDGDLDLFVVNADGPDELFSNNLDGTFRPLAEAQGLTGSIGISRGVVTADIDRDRDVDLVVYGSEGVTVFQNDRLWSYRALDTGSLGTARLQAVVAADIDTDGQVDLVAIRDDGGIESWTHGVHRDWQATDLGFRASPDGDRASLAVADFDGDGRLDLLVQDGIGLRVIPMPADGAAGRPILDVKETFVTAIPVVMAPRRGPSLVALQSAGDAGIRAVMFPPGPGRRAFVTIAVTGKEEAADSMRSNRSGIGTRLSLRAGSHWSVVSTFDNASAPGASLGPVALGLGPATNADYLAIDWSDGVFQTELDLAPGPLLTIAETQRQLSSCPVLFAWDGERYAFVSDLLGVGGIGFFVAPGEYAQPRPWEKFLLPDGLLVPRDGRYELKITEPMEEIAYLDSAMLQVYDLPAGWSVVPDDRMATGAPAPTGEPLFYRRELAPSRAFNERGDDVTARIARRDLDAAPPGTLDRRFIGRLADRHVLTFEFDAPVDAAGATLVADGWVEYPYSQTVFAAWQAGAGYDAPTLEARSGGQWQTVYKTFGYPAGMPRRMALPLPSLPAGTTALRLSTNLEVYWDALRIVYAEKPPPHTLQVLEPASARQAGTGFARRRTGAQRLPDFDYASRQPDWDTRYLTGWYSGPGDVLALVSSTDDAVAVIGPGEEVHLTYVAPAAPAPGFTRSVVLDVRGWAKDMDLYTRDGGSVEPMPARSANVAATRDVLHERYLQRYRTGRWQ